MINTLRSFAQRYLLADAAPLSRAERWRSTLAAFAGILLIEAILRILPGNGANWPLLAPLGASSVILFALPHSPLGQPWPSAGGLALSALIGMLCHLWVQPAWLAIALALAASVWLMASLRCIHPPGGAMAVLFASGFSGANTAVDTVFINILAVLFAALAVNAAIPGRRWPQCFQETPGQRPAPLIQRPGINHDDLQHALGQIDGFLDITEDDLIQVYAHALNHACERHEKRLCGEIMTPNVIAVRSNTSLNEAWQRLRQHHLKTLPVIDRHQRVIGMISADDFLPHVNPDSPYPVTEHIRRLLRGNKNPLSKTPKNVGQIMSPPGLIAEINDPVSRIVKRLSEKQQHTAVPVVDAAGKLAGILGQSDLLAALYQVHATSLATEKSPA